MWAAPPVIACETVHLGALYRVLYYGGASLGVGGCGVCVVCGGTVTGTVLFGNLPLYSTVQMRQYCTVQPAYLAAGDWYRIQSRSNYRLNLCRGTNYRLNSGDPSTDLISL